MRARSRVLALAASLVLAGSLAACGGEGPDDDATPAPGGTGTESDSPGTDDDSADSPADAASLTTADTDLGTIVVDGVGMTLYLFTNDSPGTSTCEGDCLAAWPPLLGEPAAGEGVDDALLGTIERSDGTTQATYNDWPLYYWAQDDAPGDTTGQGVNGVWWVVSPEGEAIGATS